MKPKKGMFLSARTKSVVPKAMVTVIVIFILSFSYFNLYSIGGKIFREVTAIIILYTVLTISILPVLYQKYRRMQIS